MATDKPTMIEIAPIAAETILVPIIGTTPLIVHKFAEKAKAEMLRNQQGGKAVKAPKNPQADYEACFYRTATGYGFPSIAFKAATVGACRFYKSLTMTEMRQLLFFHGETSDADSQALVPIVGEPKMREDTVRLSGKTADLRYRPEFRDWSAVLRVTFVTSSLSRNSVLSLIDAGGMGVGVGEWRPERSGEFGTYKVDLTKSIEVVE